MTPKQAALVQGSWEKMQSAGEAVAQLFYARLFGLDPSLQALFKGDMNEQGRKFAMMITFAVNGLARLEAIEPGLRALGRRHAGYGVRNEHYETVGAALVWTIGKGLGPAFTGEIRDAWTAAYRVLANTMREALKQPA
ncbi:MAG TPA: globin family protein [Burkholderiales bacterium]|jgi:hemoglobin-like flavoprotein